MSVEVGRMYTSPITAQCAYCGRTIYQGLHVDDGTPTPWFHEHGGGEWCRETKADPRVTGRCPRHALTSCADCGWL